MRETPESTITSKKSRANDLIALVESETKHEIFNNKNTDF